MPWDRLQLSSDVDSGLRVHKNAVMYRAFRTYRNRAGWTPLLSDNMGVLNSDHEERDEIIAAMHAFCKNQKKFGVEHASIEFFDLHGSWEEDMLALDDAHTFFRYHPFEDSLEVLLRDLAEHRDLVRKRADDLEMAEPPNRALQVIVLPLSGDDAEKLIRDSELRETMSQLLHCPKERIYLVVFIPGSVGRRLPVEFLRGFDYGVFLGTKNEKFLRSEVWPGMSTGGRSEVQHQVGMLYTKGFDKLRPVYPAKFRPSELKAALDLDHAEEAQMYRDYLKSLREGDSRK